MVKKKIAMIFSGGGAQYVGMGRYFYEGYPAFREVFAIAGKVMRRDFAKLCFDTDAAELAEMTNSQVAIYTVAVGMYRVFANMYGIVPVVAAGHSLGEYAALTCSGVLDFEEGLHIVCKRGDILDRIGRQYKGRMMAVSGMDPGDCMKLVTGLQHTGASIYISNYNTPDQMVLSGVEDAIEEAAIRIVAIGGQARMLDIPCCSHCPLMEAVGPEFDAFLAAFSFHESSIPIYSNITGMPFGKVREVRDSMHLHLCRPVLWENAIRAMSRCGAEVFIEMGPGSILTSLNNYIDPGIPTLSFDDPADRCLINAFLERPAGLDGPDEESDRRLAAASQPSGYREPSGDSDPISPPQDREHGIAVIGMAGRFPEAADIDLFYRNLKEGRDSVRPITLSRIWDTSLSPGLQYKQVAFLEDIDKFDCDLFNILPSEAENMAPQHRVMLELAYEAVESAGYSSRQLSGTRTSVYIASNEITYSSLAREFDPTSITGVTPACISGRISRHFNITGAAIQVDTACSSSLVAVHLACRDLLSGDAAMALCGGINLLISFAPENGDDHNVITSRQGRCLTFSSLADGAGIGEGGACIFLKPLADAVRDKDNIAAVIRATAVNQDAARSATLSSPSSIAQSEVIASAIRSARVDASTITFIEAHGTGTRIGDPLEIEGITKAFGEFTDKKHFCAISALKSNIGHCNSAAGILGVIKTILSLQKKELFPSLHVRDVNPFIDFPNSPLYLNLEHRKWLAPEGIRRAGVSAFGISGTNCHVVLEEWNEGAGVPSSNLTSPVEDGRPWLFVLSAHSGKSLENGCLALRDFVHENRHIPLENISYTLNTGKDTYRFRVSVVAASHEELICQLDKIVIPRTPNGDRPEIWLLFNGSEPRSEGFIDSLAELFPAYAAAYNACRDALRHLTTEQSLDHIFGYSFLGWISSLGVDVSKIMGWGSGKELVRILKENLPLADLSSGGMSFAGSEPPRWEQFVRNQAGKRTLLWEVGAGTRLFQQAEEAFTGNGEMEAVNPTADLSLATLLRFVGRLAEYGFGLNLSGLYKQVPYKVGLPVYQWDNRHCWIRDATHDRVFPWMYQLSWRLLQAQAPSPARLTPGTIIVWCDDNGIGEMLGERLRVHGYNVYLASDTAIDHADENACAVYIDNVLAQHGTGIWHIHLGACSGSRDPMTALAFSTGLYLVFVLAKVLGDRKGGHTLTIITDRAAEITGEEGHIDPSGTALHGFAAGIRQELGSLNTSCIDIDASEDTATLADALLAALMDQSAEPVTGLRRGAKYGRCFTRPEARKAIQLERNGVYLITGGAGGIGRQLLKAMSPCGATFIVAGRRSLPPRSLWKYVTEVSHPEEYPIVRSFLQAEENGCLIDYFQADISDPQKVNSLFRWIRNKYGRVRGIVHAAGIGGKSRIQRHTLETFPETLRPKAYGAMNLLSAAGKDGIGFFISCSSYNSIVAAERESNYSAANGFLDGFSALLNKNNIIGMTIRWPFWTETGMGSKMKDYEDLVVPQAFSLTNREGMDVFDHLLRQGYPDVLVAKRDPTPLLAAVSQAAYRRKQEHVNAEKDRTDPGDKYGTVEETLRAIWRMALSREVVGREDNFFGLGGHSLLGLRVRNQIEKKLGVQLEYRDIVQHPTFGSLVDLLEKLRSGPEESESRIIAASPQEKYPLSEAQTGLWVAWQRQQNRSLYNISFVVDLHGAVDEQSLRLATQLLMQKHEVLRTRFLIQSGSLYQKILPVNEVIVPMEVLTPRTPDEVEKVMTAAVRYVFEPEEAPLFRLWLIQRPDGPSVLSVTVHHLIMDGWSFHLFIDQLFRFYGLLIKNMEPDATPAMIQYKDYSVWERHQLSGPAMERYRRFWLGYCKDIPDVLDIPTDFPRPAERKGIAGHYRFDLTPLQLSGIDELAKKNCTGRFAVCLTLLQVLLYRYSGQEKFFIGVPSTLRYRQELENQMGYFVNILPLKCLVSGGDSFLSLLKRTADMMTAIQDNALYPFHRIVSDAGIRTVPGRHHLFDIAFSYEHHPAGSSGSKGGTAAAFNDRVYHSKYDIEFVVKDMVNEMVVGITYDANLFLETTISQLADHYLYLLDLVTMGLSIDQISFESTDPSTISREIEQLNFYL